MIAAAMISALMRLSAFKSNARIGIKINSKINFRVKVSDNGNVSSNVKVKDNVNVLG